MPTTSAQKYNSSTFFTATSLQQFNLPENISNTLVNSANHALAQKTKSTYNTAHKMLINCQEHFSEQFTFPLSERELLLFIGWNIEKGLKATTIRSYLSGLKAIHKAKGLGTLCTDTPFIKDILTGKHNLDISERNISENTRLPCTMEILNLLKQE